MQVISSTDIRIDHIEVYLPENSMPVEECLEREYSRQEMTELGSHWKDTVIDPEHLVCFMNEQTSSSRPQRQPGKYPAAVAGSPSGGVYCAGDESSSDMAVSVCRAMAGKHPDVIPRLGLLIHVQSTINEVPTSSIPCRLQHELKAHEAIPFGISQKGGNSVIAGLQLAAVMLSSEAALDSAMLCASDSFVEPYSRLLHGSVLLNDSAACMVMQKGGAGLRVLGSELRDFPESWNCQGQLGEDEDDSLWVTAQHTASVVRDLLQKLDVASESVSVVVPLNLSARTADLVIALCGFRNASPHHGGLAGSGCFANAEFMMRLRSVREETRLPEEAVIVMVGFGSGTSIGCVVLTGSPREVLK
jgi:3-oxoacyl-[acyl-carrier-protein] synthase III